jgi:hypothetical protein
MGDPRQAACVHFLLLTKRGVSAMMKRFYSFASLLAVGGLAMPATAAPRTAVFETSADRSSAQPFLFTGATLRLSLDGKASRKPELAIRFAGGTASSGMMPRIGEGIAFSAVAGSKPHMTFAGQDTKVMAKRLNMSGGAKTALIIGGVVLVAAVAAVALSDWGDAPAAAFDDE